MPRRNHPPQRRSRGAVEVEPPPLTSAELARRLVRLGLADPIILGPLPREVDADAAHFDVVETS